MANPGFSERAFEFAFNAEYCDTNAALLCGMPHIPSQVEEQWLGYDVAFELAPLAGQTCCLALQHKVSSFAENLTGNNKKFWTQMGKSPYYRFPLDIEQFNLLEHLSSLALPGIEYRYCAPSFHTEVALRGRYIAQTVMQGSVFIDVANTGQLAAGTPHNIVYQPANPVAWVLSEPGKAKLTMEPPSFGRTAFQEQSLNKTLEVVMGAVGAQIQRFEGAKNKSEEWQKLQRRLGAAGQAGDKGFAKKLALLGVLLGHYFAVTLIAQKTK